MTYQQYLARQAREQALLEDIKDGLHIAAAVVVIVTTCMIFAL